MAFVQHHDWKKAFHQVIPLRKQAKDSSHTPSPSLPTPESPLSPSSDSAATTCKNTSSSSVTAADGSSTATPQSNLATSSDVEEHSSASQVDVDPLALSAQTATYNNSRLKVIASTAESAVTDTVEHPVVSCSRENVGC